ncbi:hypothetical protein VTK56DRAFT_4310 [Thermocarpiscus australiensis]
MYIPDADGSYTGYSSTNLVHRPAPTVTSESPNFSFTGVAASLPLPSASSSDRLLPNPAGRPATLPYPATIKPSVTAPTTSTTTLADVATAASYAAGFESPSLSYQHSAAGSISSHHSSSSRANSDTYSGSETIFGEQERNLQSQGPAFDMHTYTAEPRRESGGSGSGGGHGTPYVSSEAANEAAVQGAHHHHHQHHHIAAAYVGDAPPASPHPIRHPQHQGQSTASAGSTSGTASCGAHAEDGHVAVASRH